jgi:translation initiation factor 1
MDDNLLDKFGLSKDLMIDEAIAKEDQRITVSIIKKKFGKKYTVIEGIDAKQIDIKQVTKKLKAKFACGGTCKDKVIELQGDHLAKVKDVLVQLDFPAESIDLKKAAY